MNPNPTIAPNPTQDAYRTAFVAVVLALLHLGSMRADPTQEMNELDPRRAAVAMLEGSAECTQDGVTKPVDLGMLVRPGATLKTGNESEMVLFFRQIGTMVRLRPNTTLVVESMTKFMKDEVLLKETVLNLMEGEMMFVVRVLDERSKFEIKLPGYVAAFDGAGTGRFDINAKGTILVGKRSERPLRLRPVAKPGEAIMVPPGHFFNRATERVGEASEPVLKEVRPKLDQLENLAKALTPPPRREELPREKRKVAR